MREQGVVLRYVPDISLPRRNPTTGLAIEPHFLVEGDVASLRRIESGENPQSGGLSSPTLAHQHGSGTRRGGKSDLQLEGAPSASEPGGQHGRRTGLSQAGPA